MIKRIGFDFFLKLPSPRFKRNIGMWSEMYFDTEGNIISKEKYENNKFSWIPSQSDKDFIKSLMVQVTEPGKTASWISSPSRGINNLDINYGYVDIK